jgi:NAD(P)-dependent dehydrogenase (short-subunit alcohol dehydrogenase family)
MILILGKGVLATALSVHLPHSVMVGRPDFDFAQKTDCDRLLDFYSPSVVINTVAVNHQKNAWDILITNYVSAVYLTLGFYQRMSEGQIINISSASTIWPSFPGIDSQRLCYNLSKESLSTFGRHFNRKIVNDAKPVVISTVELGRFASPMNDWHAGLELDKAVQEIGNVMITKAQQITLIK